MPDNAAQFTRGERSAALVINAQARRGERLARHAMRQLTARGITIAEAHVIFRLDSLREVVERAIARGYRLVIVGGGDGTFSNIVGAFAYQDTVLGLLPFGTGNSFARTLTIPLTLEGAVMTIAQGKVARVNLGQVNDRYFANVVDMGMTADVARTTSWRLKQAVGPFAYVLVGTRELLTHRPFRCTMRINGVEETFATSEVIVANGRYFGDTPLDPEAAITDEMLTVRTIDTPNRWMQFIRWFAFLAGNTDALRAGRRYAAAELLVTADPPQYLNIDGEVSRQTPAHFRVARKALQVMVPPGFNHE